MCDEKVRYNDVPSMEQFSANSGMATDADRRSSLNSFCHELVNEHVMFSLSYEESTCSDGVLNYTNEIMNEFQGCNPGRRCKQK